MPSTPQDPHARPLGSRRHPRRRLRGLETPFGVIVDVSDSGACVFHKGKQSVHVGQEVTLQVRHAGLELDLPARVVRIQALGFRQLEVGVEFASLSDEQLSGVRALAASEDAGFSPHVWLAA